MICNSSLFWLPIVSEQLELGQIAPREDKDNDHNDDHDNNDHDNDDDDDDHGDDGTSVYKVKDSDTRKH